MTTEQQVRAIVKGVMAFSNRIAEDEAVIALLRLVDPVELQDKIGELIAEHAALRLRLVFAEQEIKALRRVQGLQK